MQYISIQEAIEKRSGKVSLRGWIYRERKSNAKAFIVLRDSSNIIQCVVDKENVKPDVWKAAEKVIIESSLTIEGEIKKDERAPTGYEVHVSNLDIIHLAERFPITKDQSTEFLLDVRHLWIRSRELTQVWKIKAEILKAAREFYQKEKYYEVTPPIITGSACEG